MSLSFTVGGTRGLFDDGFAREVAGALDNAFGAEGDWEGHTPRHFGELAGEGWSALQNRAAAELGAEALPNLLAAGSQGRGVYLPTHVNAMTLTLSAGRPLRCASLPALRDELAELAGRWGVPLDDESLEGLVQEPDGGVADDPEIAAFARLALAANEAVRRDCPLWLFGQA
jgi:hypothetical protein